MSDGELFLEALNTLEEAGTLRSSAPQFLEALSRSSLKDSPDGVRLMQKLIHCIQPADPSVITRVTELTLAALGGPPPDEPRDHSEDEAPKRRNLGFNWDHCYEKHPKCKRAKKPSDADGSEDDC